ncbi:hypothetical protein GCM10010112_91540 [Actinoplanes lobatus]|uniref:Uncharacterized protein n=1 Tax=Actinoplanes lobatus TaxID=113568 RepID=A0A7W7HQY8_9ACTN|nr:hypothetical protein [Actinoplanes lobatus]MBB4755083.1 hypothetical protein [Actinoplanes lobatus]GGN98524.1 hypothetical protein GCM10010112_91540 [Actinoplanes lobatus]GIE40601.1 hypothetical protein Alo02nite_34990 [Actinoplanes lobatus]
MPARNANRADAPNNREAIQRAVIHDGWMERDTALVRMQEAAALWSVGQVTAADLVSLACELLVTGFDGKNLAMLAGVHARNADEEVPDLLQAALEGLGLSYYPAGSNAGLEATVRILASRVLAGRMSPLDLATWAHSNIGHDRLPIAERLVDLDDMYDILDYIDMTEQDLDNEIRAEARRITATTGDSASSVLPPASS